MREKRVRWDNPAKTSQQRTPARQSSGSNPQSAGTRSKKTKKKKTNWFLRFLLGIIKFCFAMFCGYNGSFRCGCCGQRLSCQNHRQ